MTSRCQRSEHATLHLIAAVPVERSVRPVTLAFMPTARCQVPGTGELDGSGSVEARVEGSPWRLVRRCDRPGAGVDHPRGGGVDICHFEREADGWADVASDFESVDDAGVARCYEFEGWAAGLQRDDASFDAAVDRELFGHAVVVAVERDCGPEHLRVMARVLVVAGVLAVVG